MAEQLQDWSYTQNGVTLHSLVTLPRDFQPTEQLPMIVFLHGVGERGQDLTRVRVHGIPKLFAANPDRAGRVITVSPQCPSDYVWLHLIPELEGLVAAAITEFHANPKRVSLTGLSMGGFGTWELACNRPGLFSAVAPICGGGMSWRVQALRQVPVRVFHGEADGVVPIAYSELMVSALSAAGGNVTFTRYPGVGHNSWVQAYEQSDLISWLIAQERA